MTVEEKIKANLNANLAISVLNITNESARHHGSTGAETHFRIEIVSNCFEGKKLLDRHRRVQDILENELALIKAFSLHLFTDKEWETKKEFLEKSPACRGADVIR